MPKFKASEILELDGAVWIRICKLSSVQANEDFRRNVNVMQAHRREVLAANEAGDAARTETLLKKLNEDNALMVKTYGYSLARDYLQRIVESRVFVKLSDEEFEAARRDSKTAEGELIERDTGKFRLIATINGVPANEEFRRNVALVQNQRAAIIKARAELDGLSGDARTAREKEIAAAEKQLEENNAAMTKHYGFSLTRNYLLEIVQSELYVKKS